jgi:hypothetical protein
MYLFLEEPNFDEWNVCKQFKNIYPTVFDGIDSYINVDGCFKQFIQDQKLQIVHQPDNGLCFINSLRQYFAERFDLILTINDFYIRFKYYFEKDFEFLSQFFSDLSSSEIGLKKNVKNLFDEYIIN